MEIIRKLFNEVIEMQQQQEETDLPPPEEVEENDRQVPPDWSEVEAEGEKPLTDNWWDNADGDHWPPPYFGEPEEPKANVDALRPNEKKEEL